MKKKSLFLLVSLALVFSFFSCQKEEQLSTNQDLTEVKSAIDGFDMSILLESDIEAVRQLAQATVVVPASLPAGVSGITINPAGPALPAGSSTVTITATGIYTTPIPVRAYNYLNSSEVIFTGSVPGNGTTGGSAAFVIPDYQDPGDGLPRYIMVEYQNSGWNYLVVYLQEPSKTTIQFQSNITGDIPAGGDTYTITQLGDYPSVLPEMASFRAIDANGTTISNNVLIIPPSKTTNISIEANPGTTNRTVYLQYSIDNGATWVTFETHNQLADQVSLVFDVSVDAVIIPAAGDTYTATLIGDFTTSPTGVMFIRAVSGSIEVSSSYAYFMGMTQKTTSITIVANTSTSVRPVDFQYSLDAGVTWISFQQAVQEAGGSGGPDPGDHIILKSGRIVAFNNASLYGNTGSSVMTWTQAMGILDTWKNAYFYTTQYSDGTLDNFRYTHLASSGCGAYSETGFPAGSWFVPTLDEMLEIYERKNEVTNLILTPSPAYYWASTEILSSANPGRQTNYVELNYGWRYPNSGADKSGPNTFYARCVAFLE